MVKDDEPLNVAVCVFPSNTLYTSVFTTHGTSFAILFDYWTFAGSKMGKRAVAGLLCTSIMAILVTQFFWINLSIPPEYCPTSMSTPVTLPTPAFEPIEDAREGLPLQGPQNSTLGFQKIYYISLPG